MSMGRFDSLYFLSKLTRYIATPRVGKHRIFVWLDKSVLPDTTLVVFAREDDYFFGVLHSKLHEIWARRKGTQLRDAESGFRYTHTTAFETFPMPFLPSNEPSGKENPFVAEIADAARRLVNFRDAWMSPKGLGEYVSAKHLTLVNLYNALEIYRHEFKGKQRNARLWEAEVKGVTLGEIEELDTIHSELDRAVLSAYGWPRSLNDEQILVRLLKLNAERVTSYAD